jgi:hypothetical protein
VPKSAKGKARASVNKTHATAASVADHLAAIADEAQREDCKALVTLMKEITGHRPKMWGPTIVGFGQYHYVYESGREGDAPVAGFAARGREIVIYLVASSPRQAGLLARLGKHRRGKSCLYIRRLADVDFAIVEALVRDSIDEVRQRYG